MKLKQLFNEYEWCQNALAYDADMEEVNPRSSKAEKFCLIGGLQRCYRDKELRAMKTKLSRFIKIYYSEIKDTTTDDIIIEFNDNHADEDEVKRLVNALDI